MADEKQAPEQDATKAETTPAGPKPDERGADERDSREAKLRRKYESKIESLTSKLTQLESAQKTAEEKALEAEYMRGLQEAESRLSAQIHSERIQAAILRTLAGRQIPEGQVHVIMAENPELETVEEAIDASTRFADRWGEWTNRKSHPGIPGAPTGPSKDPHRPWTEAKVAEVRVTKGDKFLNDHWGEILQDKKLPGWRDA